MTLESFIYNEITMDEQSRTIYVRLPHTIKSVNDVKNLVTSYEKIKLPRQSSRYCHVVFKTVDDKNNNFKRLFGQTVDGKSIFVSFPKTPNVSICRSKKKKLKKIIINKPEESIKITRTLFVSNIPCGTKIVELKEAFPGCVTLTMLKGSKANCRRAVIKMENIDLASQYIKKQRPWPSIRGVTLHINCDTRKSKKYHNK